MKKALVWITAIVLCLVITLFFSMMGCKAEAVEETTATEMKAPEDYEIVLVFKLVGIPWSDSLEVGMEKFSNDTGVNAYMIGAETTDPIAQIALVDDLIAKGVDAILVVPNDPGSMEPTLKKAQDAGILTLAHEADQMANIVYDLEAFGNEAFGAFQMDVMAEWMGSKGEWVASVGELTSPNHNAWVDAAETRAEETYPDIVEVTERFETHADAQTAYEKCQEVIKTYPDIKAFLGISTDMPSYCQVVQEKGLTGQIGIFGSTLPSAIGPYMESGECVAFQFWVPEYASYALAMLAWNILQGNEITEGMSLGVPGYESVTMSTSPNTGTDVISGQAWVNITKDNLDEWKTESGDYKL